MFKINLNKAAFYIVPLIIVSPLIRLGPYGILFTDALIIMTGIIFLLKGNVRIRNFFFIFLLMFTIGWIGSNVWALLRFGYRPQLAELNQLYRILFYCSAFWVGSNSNYDLEEILSSRFTQIVLILLTLVIILYFILDPDLRPGLMKLFISSEELDMQRGRFPGLNSNINVYSFIILMVALFSFYYLIKGNKKLILPFILTSFVLIAGRSRKIMIFYLAFVILGILKYYFYESETRLIKKYKIKFRTALILISIITGLTVTGYIFLRTDYGARIIAGFKILLLNEEKTQDLRSHYGTVSDFNLRFQYMKKGLARVAESPVFGIPKIRGDSVESNSIILFHKAHNEFIVIWMYYGIIALVGFALFFFYTIYTNLRKQQYVWAYLYLILMLQAFFDTAFFSYQLCSMLFIFVGLNYRDKLNNMSANI